MIIRSQDRTKLFHFDSGNIKVDTVLNGMSLIQAHNYAGWIQLGEYESEERATEVLDAIYGALNVGYRVFQMPQKMPQKEVME